MPRPGAMPMGPLLLVLAVLAVGAAGQSRSMVLSNVDYLAPGRSEKLDVWRTLQGRAPRPAVVLIHGGAWHRGTKSNDTLQQTARVLNEAGYVVFAPDYALSQMRRPLGRAPEVVLPAWPRNLQDCKAAVRFARARAEDFDVDPERVVVGGFSAGAHLALMVALTADDPEWDGADAPHAEHSSAVAAVLDLYGIAEITQPWEVDHIVGPADPAGPEAVERMLSRSSPLEHVGPGCPPVFIAHGAKDDKVDPERSRRLAAALERHGVPHELHLLADEGHGFGLAVVREPALAFLEHHLAPTEPEGFEPEQPGDG